MNLQTILLKISFTIFIFGILFLLILLNITKPKQINIKDIKIKFLNKKIKTIGIIEKIKIYKNYDFQTITIKDFNYKINIILKNSLNLRKNQKIIVFGRLTQYKNNLQIQADKIII